MSFKRQIREEADESFEEDEEVVDTDDYDDENEPAMEEFGHVRKLLSPASKKPKIENECSEEGGKNSGWKLNLKVHKDLCFRRSPERRHRT